MAAHASIGYTLDALASAKPPEIVKSLGCIEAKGVEGKGRRVVAKCDLQKGDVVLVQQPLASAGHNTFEPGDLSGKFKVVTSVNCSTRLVEDESHLVLKSMLTSLSSTYAVIAGVLAVSESMCAASASTAL